MNRDRGPTKRHVYQLRLPAGLPRAVRAGGLAEKLDPADIAPWVIAAVRAWPRSVDDGVVAVRMGVQPHHVRLARSDAPASSHAQRSRLVA